MAGKITGNQMTYILEDAEIKRYTGVTYGTDEGSCKIPAADNAVFLGVVTNDERLQTSLSAGGSQAGRNIAVQIDLYGEIKLSGTCAYGERLILGANGVAKKMPAAAGTYNVIGFAEKIGADGEIVPFKIAPHTWTVEA